MATGFFIVLVIGVLSPDHAQANGDIRSAFFAAYPSAVGTALDTLPSRSTHCGVCHYRFSGGGQRNPYGEAVSLALASYPSTDSGRRDAILFLGDVDSDSDGHSTVVEVTDTSGYINTPTFPGLTPGNVGLTSRIPLEEIEDYLVPSTGGDNTPPEVNVLAPNGGETLVANTPATALWTASDPSGVIAVDLLLSLDGGASFDPVAVGMSNTGSREWFPANRPTTEAIVRVVATDAAGNQGYDDSDAVFTIESPVGGRVPTTLRDFDLPNTQPFEGGAPIDEPQNCGICHGNYAPETEPYFTWQGGMMAHASRDILFQATMAIGNEDAPDSGDLCLRCHIYAGWVQGRSVPTDGSQMIAADKGGVSCALCHRMVDPIFNPGVSPEPDESILSLLSNPGTEFANGMLVLDPDADFRGPVVDSASPHSFLVSPFHQEAALCGTCHDVSNPVFEKNNEGEYVPNAMDTPAAQTSSQHLLAVERTYSEWFFSEYNTEEGVYAPEFAGTKPDGRVATCQDCHMRDVSGHGCNPNFFPQVPLRHDLPLHDMTGGSTWLPSLLPQTHPDEVNAEALQAGIERATIMLQLAASLTVEAEGSVLTVTVTNQTGHKLPTGYPEGRRMWLNVQFFDEGMNLLRESAAYDPSTGVLDQTGDAKVYEVKPGISEGLAAALGLEAGPSFHFVLNDTVYKDNRIPPRGFVNSDYDAFGGAPVGQVYADGQYWDQTRYDIPDGTTAVQARLYYQSTSKEFVEFLRDEDTTSGLGQELYALWDENEKCPPVEMALAAWSQIPPILEVLPQSGSDIARDGYRFNFSAGTPGTYVIEFTEDFTTWTTVETFDYVGGVKEVIDTQASASLTRFYRARMP